MLYQESGFYLMVILEIYYFKAMLYYAFALHLNICIVDKNTFQKSNIQHNIIVGVGTA